MAKKYCVRAVYPSGQEAYLKHGGKAGYGAIVQFRTRKLAEANRCFLMMGVDPGVNVDVVLYDPDYEDADVKQGVAINMVEEAINAAEGATPEPEQESETRR